MSNVLVNKILNVLATLLDQAKVVDYQNSHQKAYRLRQDNTMFSESLFSTNSNNLVPYVLEAQAKTNEITKLMGKHNDQFTYQRLELVEQQISAIINAINANDSQNKASQRQLSLIKKKRYKKVAQSIIQSSQSLYQKLAETHEFERRLQVMLDEKQRELGDSNVRNRTKISEELLVLHQRLGRCRQAISKLERQIELSEKR